MTHSRALLHRFIIHDARRRGASTLSIADFGAGGCDLMIWFARHCRRMGMEARISCIDADPRIVAYAERVIRRVEGLRVIEGGTQVLLDEGPFDYVFSNHVLHHIPTEELPRVLRAVAHSARHMWLMNDVRRSAVAYRAFTLLASPLFRGSFAVEDGKRSIRRALTPREILVAARQAHVDLIGRRGIAWRLVAFGSGLSSSELGVEAESVGTVEKDRETADDEAEVSHTDRIHPDTDGDHHHLDGE